MPKFRVTIKKVLDTNRIKDPRVPIAKVLHRQWDIEAASADQARANFEAAVREDLPTVRGFELESIEEIVTNGSSPPFGFSGR